ncbi:MAG: AAA family ATPase [Solirubrobacteraceae bacterium]
MTSVEPTPQYNSQLTLVQAPVAQDDRATAPDRRDGSVYAFDDWLRLSVEIALATGRPLLVRGEPGSGKSSLAAFIARNRNWRYYEQTFTSETRVRDVLWRWDAVRRLADAQIKKSRPDAQYVEPGILWWAFNRDSARTRGAGLGSGVSFAEEPNADLNAQRAPEHAVVLIDEIDKADPDVPNGLLEPLASFSFRVEETGVLVSAPEQPDQAGVPADAQHLIVITTNQERELPPAFMRRCIVHELRHPGDTQLVQIARLHFGGLEGRLDPQMEELCVALAARLATLRDEPDRGARRKPSTAEYLDAVEACRRLNIWPDPESPTWQAVESATWLKEAGQEEPDAW